MNPFAILSFKELPKELIEEAEDWCDHKWRTFVIKTVNGKSKIIHCDGGEPEDQTLGRDWSWVGGALDEAYQSGLTDGACVKEKNG